MPHQISHLWNFERKMFWWGICFIGASLAYFSHFKFHAPMSYVTAIIMLGIITDAVIANHIHHKVAYGDDQNFL